MAKIYKNVSRNLTKNYDRQPAVVKPVEKSDKFSSIIPMSFSDGQRLKHFMTAELNCYNHLVTVFGSQFNRDYSIFLEITEDQVKLFGELCFNPVDIYNIKDSNLPTNLSKYSEILKSMTSKLRYLFTDAARAFNIVPNIRKRMGMSILNFFITQSGVRNINKRLTPISDDDTFVHSKAPYNSLHTVTSFNKRHLQIDKESCIIKKNTKEGTMSIKIPYRTTPLEFNNMNFITRNWNYLVIRQVDKIETSMSEWVVDFKKIPNDSYMTKFMDRLGRSSIFEIAKQR